MLRSCVLPFFQAFVLAQAPALHTKKIFQCCFQKTLENNQKPIYTFPLFRIDFLKELPCIFQCTLKVLLKEVISRGTCVFLLMTQNTENKSGTFKNLKMQSHFMELEGRLGGRVRDNFLSTLTSFGFVIWNWR